MQAGWNSLRARLWGALALAPAAVFAAGLLAAIGCGGDESGGGGGGGGFSMPPTPVEVSPVTRGELIDRFDAIGTFEAVNAIEVVSEVSGIVRDLPFTEGQPVRRGELLVRLEDSELVATLHRAEAVLEQNRNRFERVQRIVEQKAGAPQDLDDAVAELRVAEADVALARARLEKTRVRAPFDGYVGPRHVSPGSYLRAGETITELTELDLLEVVFSAPERYLPRLNVGASISVSTPAYPGFESAGKLTIVGPTVDSDTRTIQIVGTVPNPGLRFRPGMSTDVRAILDRKSNALTIPSAAVFADGNQTLVFVVGADSTVQRVPVVLGTRLSATVEVLEGVAAGDQVVRAGHQKLFPGAKVLPIPERGAAPEAPDDEPDREAGDEGTEG